MSKCSKRTDGVGNYLKYLNKDEIEELYTCKHCGMPSCFDPLDQTPPLDYCHESDHRSIEQDISLDSTLESV